MREACRMNVENDVRAEQDKVGWQEMKKTGKAVTATTMETMKRKKRKWKNRGNRRNRRKNRKKRKKRKKTKTKMHRKKDSPMQDGRRQECQCVGLLPFRQRCLEPASLSTTINNSPGYVGGLFFVVYGAASLFHTHGTSVFRPHREYGGIVVSVDRLD